MNNLLIGIPLVAILFLSVFVFSCNRLVEKDVNQPKYELSIITDIEDEETEFRKTEKEKDGDNHRPLFISASSPIDFILKNYGGPFLYPLRRDAWIGFFTSFNYDYYALYTDHNYYIENGMAVDQHKFQGYKDNIKDIYGSDLFFYVSTATGLKLLSICTTVVNPDDSTDYSTKTLINTIPETTIETFENGFNTKDTFLFLSSFLENNTPCFAIENSLTATYVDKMHSAAAFYSIGIEKSIHFTAIKTTIHDQLTAVASADYTVSMNGIAIEKGRMLSTLAGTPEGWKFNALILSINK